MKVHAYVYYTEMLEKCLQFDIELEHLKNEDWMEAIKDGTIYDAVEKQGKETLNKMMDENEELRYIIDDIGYERIS